LRYLDALRVVATVVFALSTHSAATNESSAVALQPDNFPGAAFASADLNSNKLYRIDSARSDIVIRVYRAGLMQRLGHDHIVASRHLQGYVLLKDDAGTADACRATFFVPLAALIVDDPALREQANLTTKPSPASIAGTKRNMLLSLDAEVFPFVHLTSTNCSPGLNGGPVTTFLTLHGVTREQTLQATLIKIDGNTLQLEGDFSLHQSDFGITPFSVMNGLLKVQDKLDLSYHLVAKRVYEAE
jgi:hypothetical protein